MNLSQLLSFAHLRLDEPSPPYLWMDDELLLYLNNVINEWALDVRSIMDSDTPEICHISLLGDVSTYPLDVRVIDVVDAYLSSQSIPLESVSMRQLDIYYGDWRKSKGTPTAYIPLASVKGHNGTIRVCPFFELKSGDDPATVYNMLNMDVIRYPLNELSLDNLTAEPEFHYTQHSELISGVLREAYLKPDSQTFSQALSDKWGEKFENAKAAAKNLKIELGDDEAIMTPNEGAL